MLTVKFPIGQKVRTIILDKPIHCDLSGNGVNGMVECVFCDCRAGLMEAFSDRLAEEIERFALNHKCDNPVVSKEIFISELKKQLAQRGKG